ncbi:Aconitase domain-containing protein [Cephalotus follicularis]|uniref:Aconitase domain-containing protein n=1 Tax=Cephalotus follicularis TaxID=3775 RepID=A0A1Q3ATL2_CEPFO|nr:Aconitase domain-containing protein [Cephalotus follicularis]
MVNGEMPDYLLAKDLILQMEERMTLCNMVVEARGKNGVVPADSTTFKYLEDKTSVAYEPVYSDGQASFLSEYSFDMSKLEPLVAKPHSPDNCILAREYKDVKIGRVYIGSCIGGKTEDFIAAAKVFLTSVRTLYFHYLFFSLLNISSSQQLAYELLIYRHKN